MPIKKETYIAKYAVSSVCWNYVVVDMTFGSDRGLDKRGADMAQINMVEEKTEMSKLINLLETKQEEVIYFARNGMAVAQLTLIPKKITGKRIGVAEGKFKVPDEFDSWDKEVGEMFGGEI